MGLAGSGSGTSAVLLTTYELPPAGTARLRAPRLPGANRAAAAKAVHRAVIQNSMRECAQPRRSRRVCMVTNPLLYRWESCLRTISLGLSIGQAERNSKATLCDQAPRNSSVTRMSSAECVQMSAASDRGHGRVEAGGGHRGSRELSAW